MSDELAALLLPSGRFSVVTAPLVQTAPVVVPVTKAATATTAKPKSKPKAKRPRKRA